MDYNLKDVQLLTLNLSCNLFQQFPYNALRMQREMVKLDISRNQIKSIDFDFKVFLKLRLLDISSNKLTEFPLCIKDCPLLRILRLIHN